MTLDRRQAAVVAPLEQQITERGGELVADLTPVSGAAIDARRPVPTVIADCGGVTVAVQRPTFRAAVEAVREALNLEGGSHV